MKFTQVAMFRVDLFLVCVFEVRDAKGIKAPYVKVSYEKKGLTVSKYFQDSKEIVDKIEKLSSILIDAMNLQDWDTTRS